MSILTKTIATIATNVISEMNRRKEIASARRDMFDYCERNGHHVTEVMYNNPVDFMRAVEEAGKKGKVIIKYRNFPVTFNRSGNKERIDWSRFDNVITVHSGKFKF